MYTKSFVNLKDAYDWAINYVQENTSTIFQLNPICEDRFKSARPKGRNRKIFELFGTTWSVERKVRSIEPNGSWNLEIHNDYDQKYFLIWYNRFLPYAQAMVLSESGFEQSGIDYTSMMALYKTVCGFTDLGNDENGYISENDSKYQRILGGDVELFQNIYNASMDLKPPYLPYDEAFQPCLIYLALKKPKLFKKHFRTDHYLFEHIEEVCKMIGPELTKVNESRTCN